MTAATEAALRAELDQLTSEFEAFKTETETFREEARGRLATCQIESAKLSASVDLLSSQVEKVTASNAALLQQLLDMASGRIAREHERADKREERADNRYKLLLDRFGAPVGKAVAALAGLAFTALASWWAGRVGMGLPVSSMPAPAPVTIEAEENP